MLLTRDVMKHLTIGSLDDHDLTVRAQYNPKELKVSQASPWHEHRKQGREAEDALHLEYGTLQPRTLAVELLFDGVEHGGRLGANDARTVREAIGVLENLIAVRPRKLAHEDWRPHCCVVTWGTGGMPPICCVIEHLDTTYQVVAPSGRALRATCAVQLKEASRVDKSLKAATTRQRLAGLRAVELARLSALSRSR